MTANRRVCDYCDTVNTKGRNCIACGAPLPKSAPHPKPEPQPKPQADSVLDKFEEEETLERAATFVAQTYTRMWTTLAEAMAIAVVSLGIGITAGVTGVPWVGILGGVAVGLAVGWAIKIPYLSFLMAPLGMVVGAVLGLLLWFAGLRWAVVTPMIIMSVLGGVLGSRYVPYRLRNDWHKMRPWLGALGGFGCGLAGTLIGWGLQTIVSGWLG